jgi:ABC-type transport system involved in Fe-S cluster assembly fused permease/ATPase subunit
VIQLFAPLNFLGSVYNFLVMAMIDLKNLSQLLSESHDIEDVPGAVNIPPIARSASGPVVTFNNIRFH